MRQLTFTLSLLASLTFAPIAAAAAPPRPIPDAQWNPRAHLWLSRAMVAEAGWRSSADHAAIAWVLARRWERQQARFPYQRFVDVVRQYSRPLDPTRAVKGRLRWLRGLAFSYAEPRGWPRRRASWVVHAPLWRRIVDRAEAWARGELADPCRGRAWHWGAPDLESDRPSGRMVAIECKPRTRNVFYRLAPRGTLAAR